MADQIGESATLKFDLYFVDGDTRALTLKNPKSSITTSDIEELQTFMRTKNIVIGDKNGGTFGKISAVTKINERRIILDPDSPT